MSFHGFDYPTRMVIVRLSYGLWLWSPVKGMAALEQEIRALGPVRHIVSPNNLHHLFLAEWLGYPPIDYRISFPSPDLQSNVDRIARRPLLHRRVRRESLLGH